MTDAPPLLRQLAADVAAGNQTLHTLPPALQQSRPSDAITLLNLLWRTPEPERRLVYQRLVEWKPPPETVSWERLQREDWTVIAEWWPHLGFRKTVKLPPRFYAN
jgi:hypothetical protein